jgi:hypothetical protein
MVEGRMRRVRPTGMYPKQVKRIFRRSTPLQPTSRNTPTGGRRIARSYKQGRY